MRQLPDSWLAAVGSELTKPYYENLITFVDAERATKTVFPPEHEVFRALELVSFDAVRVLILGQDPYHDDGQAHGLCFSVKPPTKPPPSLRNIFKELHSDLGIPPPDHGDLTAWALRGVLLLNTVLTVEAHKAASHAGKGWETFTDAIITALNLRPDPVVFCLWGGHARKKVVLIDQQRHAVIQGAHPSPLSQKKFLGSRPFSAINAALTAQNRLPLDWTLS